MPKHFYFIAFLPLFLSHSRCAYTLIMFALVDFHKRRTCIRNSVLNNLEVYVYMLHGKGDHFEQHYFQA